MEERFKCLSVVIPCYKERNTIENLIKKVKEVDLGDMEKEIIIVDDASTDGTPEVLKLLSQQDPRLRVAFQEVNQGKGAALRRGFQMATGDLVIVQDADLEYDPEDYKVLLSPVLKGQADVVIGSRFRGSESRVLFFWHTVGNKFLTLLSNIFTNLNLTDMETCYKLFKREIIQSLKLEANRFGFEPEVVAKVSKIKGIRIYEVPVKYFGRTYEEGKKIGWKDGVAAIYFILKYNILG